MDQFFDISSRWQVAICRQCQHAIWPSSIKGHLKNYHGLLAKEALRIQREVQASSVIQDPADLMRKALCNYNAANHKKADRVGVHQALKCLTAPTLDRERWSNDSLVPKDEVSRVLLSLLQPHRLCSIPSHQSLVGDNSYSRAFAYDSSVPQSRSSRRQASGRRAK